MARRGWEICAAEEGLALRRAEDGHRPAAVTGHCLGGFHVDRVDVGALLTVDLDIDEVVVHQAGRLGVLE
jgi:hypothetical protein